MHRKARLEVCFALDAAAFLTQTVELSDEMSVKFEIWDTAGQERYHSLAPMYYRGAQAAMVIFDVSTEVGSCIYIYLIRCCSHHPLLDYNEFWMSFQI